MFSTLLYPIKLTYYLYIEEIKVNKILHSHLISHRLFAGMARYSKHNSGYCSVSRMSVALYHSVYALRSQWPFLEIPCLHNNSLL